MAELEGRPKVDIDVTIRLNEVECRALDAMTGYGVDQFVKSFYERLGEAYMKKHEAGLRSFLTGVRQTMPAILAKADKAREAFTEK